MISGRTLPKEVADKWPEVLTGIKMNQVPLRYLDSVMVNFKDDKVWEICITAQTRSKGWIEFNKIMDDFMKTYDHRVETVQYEINTVRLIKDIQLLTKKFLRKYKL